MGTTRRLIPLTMLAIGSLLASHGGLHAGSNNLAKFTLADLDAELKARTGPAGDNKSTDQVRPKGGQSALAGFTSRTLIAELNVREKAIYGSDDRLEAFDAPSTQPARNLRSTAALVRPARLQRQTDGTWKILARSFREEVNVCPDERFAKQPVPGFCTGFLIAPDRLVTAGHCVKSTADLGSVLVVFGFEMRTNDTLAAPIRDADVYRPIELLGRAQDSHGPDWAVVRLDRAVVGRESLPLNPRPIADGEPVYVVGHPVGLPKKFGGLHAAVRDNKAAAYFVANLNTFGGNSGSPVFDFKRGEVAGLLVRGETDFRKTDEGCLLSLVCPDTGCRGEEVTRIVQIPQALRAARVPSRGTRP
jgi:hypothetical protein